MRPLALASASGTFFIGPSLPRHVASSTDETAAHRAREAAASPALRLGPLGVPASLVAVLVTGVAARLLLTPLMHPWDGQTFLSLFAELNAGGNPYATFHELTLEARSRYHFGWARWYEYYAYPPFLIYLYWPLAKLCGALIPLATAFTVPGSGMVDGIRFPTAFLVLYKLPIWAADTAIALMLWRMTHRVGVVALWFLNPLVLVVSGAWMFDAIPVALTLGAVLLAERGRAAWAGALLGLGFLAKFFPLFLLPVLFMHFAWRRDRGAFTLVGAFAAVSVALSWPYRAGVGEVLAFNASRGGGGLTLHQVVLSLTRMSGGALLTFENAVSPAVGALTLVGGMTAAYWYLNRHRPTLRRSVLIALVAFLLSSKLVNEQYAMWALPFLLVEAEQVQSVAARAVAHLAWLVPFALLLVHVPAAAFLPGPHAPLPRIIETPPLLDAAFIAAAVAFTLVLVAALVVFRPHARGLRPSPRKEAVVEVSA